MRGAPRTEMLLILLVGMLTLWPMTRLTRAQTPTHFYTVSVSETDQQDAWLDVRFSHPPQSFRVFQDDTLLFTSEGLARDDDEVTLSLQDHRILLKVEMSFSPDVTQTYTEITLEPGLLPRQTQGFWSGGPEPVHRVLEFSWPIPQL